MKKSTALIIAAALLVIVLNSASQISPPIHYLDPYNPEYAEGVVLVKMRDESGIRTYADFIASAAYQTIQGNFKLEKTVQMFPRAQKPIQRTLNTFNGQMIQLHDLATIFKLRLAPGVDAKAAAEAIAGYPDIEFAEPDYLVYTMLEPDDPLAGEQWHLDAFPGVNAKTAWDSTTGDTLQIIGIIDTGVDWDHPDLAEKIWNNWDEVNGIAGSDDDGNGFVDDFRGWDWINEDNDPNDDNCHGTHVAGIAAAESNNGIGVAGISWGAKIMPLKVLQSSGYGTMSDVALAAEYAYENSATVINMSLGSYGESMTLKTTLENAYAYCALVAAAGNDGKPIEIFPMFPACYSFVLGTEASTNTGSKASFSNFDPSGPLTCGNSYGYNYEMKAPGVSIMSTFPNGGYDELNGTSMASPMVAGAVALIKTIDPDIQNTTLFANLIYSANNGILDIANALEYELGEPDLHFVDYAMVDTLGGGDNDGRADAGEMIEIWLTVKNTAGWADSVWSKIRFGQFEDTTVANIIDSTSYIGDISTFATYTGEPDPIVIQISPDVANYRDIVFEYEIGAANWGETIEGTIILKAYNTVELGGLFNSDTTLTADYEYWMTENLRVMPGCTLTLNPGVHIVMMGNKTLDVAGILIANGTPDSMVDFSSSGNNSDLILESTSTCILNYTIFNGINNGQIITCAFSNIIFNNVVFKDCSNLFDFSNPSMGSLITNCSNIINCVGVRTVECSQIINCNIINNYGYNNFVYCYGYNSLIDSSCFFNNQSYSIAAPYWLSFNISNNYWGTTDTSLIHEEEIWDFYDDGSLAVAVLSPVLEQPPAENHGIVWKVEINGQNPQYAAIDPLGCETVQFDAYFNRAMDIEETPFLTFGVCEPFTQHVIDDSASWSADSTIYTAYYTVGLETGDGINTVRVANAKDTDHFEIPVEYTRFKFNIQAAAGASVNFMATPGIGKVELEWPQAPSPDLLGYNMYRFNQINDTTYTDTGFINSSLITDTLYTDFDVLPDCTYFYLYTVISTDMDESNYSNSVPATPFSAPTGDA
ncbi:MAG: S8 family serine peptidase, partial [FCB group bacterium]|nr:S8 family serine peptidase [FCB group bacterium]